MRENDEPFKKGNLSGWRTDRIHVVVVVVVVAVVVVPSPPPPPLLLTVSLLLDTVRHALGWRGLRAHAGGASRIL